MYALIERHLPPGWSLIRGARLLRVDEQPFPNQSVACGCACGEQHSWNEDTVGNLDSPACLNGGLGPLRWPPPCPVLSSDHVHSGSSDHVPPPLPCPDAAQEAP